MPYANQPSVAITGKWINNDFLNIVCSYLFQFIHRFEWRVLQIQHRRHRSEFGKFYQKNHDCRNPNNGHWLGAAWVKLHCFEWWVFGSPSRSNSTGKILSSNTFKISTVKPTPKKFIKKLFMSSGWYYRTFWLDS